MSLRVHHTSPFALLRGPGAVSLVLIAVFLLSLLIPAQARTFDVKKPSLKLKGVSIKSIDLSTRTAETELLISIDNPGPAFKVKDLSYRLKLNEKQAAQGKYNKAIELSAESVTELELPCDVDLSALPGVAWAIISGGFDVRYELETEFAVPIFGSFNPRLKNSITGQISLVQTVSGWTGQIKEHIAGK